MKHRISIALFLTLILSAFPGHLLAASEGNPCKSEPTNDFMYYGDLITCTISPVVDSDLFRFIGESGEKIIIQASEGSGLSSSPNPCIELFRPDSSLLTSACHEINARMTIILDQSGQHTIRVTEANNDQEMNYTLVLERIWPPSPSAKPISSGIAIEDEQIDPFADLDLYIFQGEINDLVSLRSTEGSGLSSSPDPCIELYGPDGSLLSTNCHEISAIIQPTLVMAGTHVLLIYEAGNDQAMTHNVEYQCIIGNGCPPLDDTCGGEDATIIGTEDDNVIMGTDGDDVIVGLGGNDIIYGLDGSDRICGGDGDDIIYGGKGTDRLFGNSGNDVLYGENGADHLYGGSGYDTLNGGYWHDTLNGGTGNDTLYGARGDDELIGNVGVDVCDGGQHDTEDIADETCECTVNIP